MPEDVGIVNINKVLHNFVNIFNFSYLLKFVHKHYFTKTVILVSKRACKLEIKQKILNIAKSWESQQHEVGWI